jgi:hypothetical protein
LIDRLTPNIDEQKEIVRGNSAVAEYFGRVAGATIIGMSLVIAAAVLGGVIAALHCAFASHRTFIKHAGFVEVSIRRWAILSHAVPLSYLLLLGHGWRRMSRRMHTGSDPGEPL